MMLSTQNVNTACESMCFDAKYCTELVLITKLAMRLKTETSFIFICE